MDSNIDLNKFNDFKWIQILIQIDFINSNWLNPNSKYFKQSINASWNYTKSPVTSSHSDKKHPSLKTWFQVLSQIVECPTHKDGRTIDHIYVSSEFMKCVDLEVMFKYYTDHAALQIKFKY